ncbi:pyridoxamine 5'-phosphate oxidase family protein [Nocardia takedensis]|uniref:pyridoxamine 5'-phosphate oxidase family protein n=1 Tax=Nocardia takedensis TaxID=259390 RepID=UPI003F75D0E1
MQGGWSSKLVELLLGFPLTYLITTGIDRRPHVVVAGAVGEADTVRIGRVGPATRPNIAACPEVTVLRPPVPVDGHSPIIDGTASRHDDVVVALARTAILHRDYPSRVRGSAAGRSVDLCR